MGDTVADAASSTTALRHEALVYDGPEAFARALLPFVADGLARGDAVLAVLPPDRIDRLWDALGDDAGRVDVADMTDVGRNPARIIPAWHEYVAAQAERGRTVRGIGEPIHGGRDDVEVDECHRHEALLNHAFADLPPWRLLCPYDRRSLPAPVVDAAATTHPVLCTEAGAGASPRYQVSLAEVLAGSLPPPPADAIVVPFGAGGLGPLRALVLDRTRPVLGDLRAAELLSAVGEITANSIRHGGGGGVLHLWEAPGKVVCHVADQGRIADPLVGRVAPDVRATSGRGLWIANQLCDLVQVRSGPGGTTVRLHAAARRP